MILENGVIRTLDPSLPVARALAIAGGRIAGGVGVHETALASPETVDLGGRTVVPGFSDAHVHFPAWALVQSHVRLEGCATVADALDLVAAAEPGASGWIRGLGWRFADERPTRTALDEATGATPAALWAKDTHALWLNSAAYAAAGEPPGDGVLVETDAWAFRDRHLRVPPEEYLDAMRRGVETAARRGVTAVHDKDGALGALALWARLDTRRLRVWQSVPADRVEHVAALGLDGALGNGFLRLGYLKVFMDGT